MTRFDIKSWGKKAGRSIKIWAINYYTWSFEMTMQKIQNTHLEVHFSIVNFKVIFLQNSNSTDLKLKKNFLFAHQLVEYNASFVWFGLEWRGDALNNVEDIISLEFCFQNSPNLCKLFNLWKVINFWIATKRNFEHLYE